MERQWESKAIDLGSVSVERYSFCRPHKDPKRATTITFFDPTEATLRPGTRGQEMSRDQLYRVEGGEKLVQEVESAALELNIMVSSPHIGGLKGKVQMLRSSLQQASELFSFLLLCLDQVCLNHCTHTHSESLYSCTDIYISYCLVVGSAGVVSLYKARGPQVEWSSESSGS